MKYGRRSGMALPGASGNRTLFVLYQCFIGIFLLYKLVCTTYAIITIDKFQVRVYLLSALIFFLTGLFLQAFFAVSGRRFRRLLERTDRLSAMLSRSRLGHEDLLVSEHRKAVSRITLFARVMAVLSFICPFAFCLSVPIIDFLEGNYRSRTAVPAQCPIELDLQKLPGVFEAIVIQQGLAYVVPCFHRIITECMMLGLFRLQSSYLSYLGLVMESLAENPKAVSIRRWIILHQQVVLHGSELSSFFSPVIVMYYLSTIVFVAGSLLYMMDADSSNILQTLFGGGYMIVSLLQLYLQCHAADDITDLGEKLSLPVYFLPWYKMNKDTRTTLQLIITVTNTPVHLQAYQSPAFRLSKVNYQALFLNTVSTFMAFRKIRSMESEDH